MKAIHELTPSIKFDHRGGHNRYNCNFDFFKKWSGKMTYVLGFLYADGDIVDAINSSRTQYIKFTSKDRGIIEKIRSVLKAEHPIHSRPPHTSVDKYGRLYRSGEVFYLRIGSRRMFADLKKIGLMPNKSKVIQFPDKISSQYLGEFIRGYFDGDGSITFNKNGRWIRVIFTSGSRDFLKQLSKRIAESLKIRERPIYISHYSYQLCYFTQEGLKLLNFIYKKAGRDNLYLDRKYDFYRKLAVQYNYILDKYITQVAG